MLERVSNAHLYYSVSNIISSIDECVLFILLIFNICQAHCSDIIQTLRIELILTCMFYTCTYIFPFFHEEDTQSIPCRLQSLLFTSSSIATAINVFTLSFLNMKLFTPKVLYEKKICLIYFLHYIISYIIPFTVCFSLGCWRSRRKIKELDRGILFLEYHSRLFAPFLNVNYLNINFTKNIISCFIINKSFLKI